MLHLIDKAALVAEIESKRKYAQTLGDNAINSSMQQFYDGMKQGCVDILSFIDTLEVKDENAIKRDWYNKGYIKGRKEASIPARELGLPSALDMSLR